MTSTLFINLLIGAIIGLAMSVPVGPSGVIGVKRIIARGTSAGVACGFGVALADVLFATIALAGISSIADFLQTYAERIQLIGGVFIIIVGVTGLRKGPHLRELNSQGGLSLAAVRDVTSMMAITLANPQTIIGFSTSFAASVAFYEIETNAQIAALAGGVFIGSFMMWALLSYFIGQWREVMQESLIVKLHHFASYFVILIGLGLIIHALKLGDAIKLS